MNLLGLKLHHFLSYQDEQFICKDNNIYFITGINIDTNEKIGVGKSAIKEAIRYALYGKCRVTADDAIMFGKKEMTVQLDFEFGDNYRIRRSRKRNTSTKICFVNLTKKKDLTCSKNKNTQEVIEGIIGLGYEQFMHSFCFGQSEFDDLKNLTPTKLIDFLKKALKLDRFDYYLEKVKKYQEKTKNTINRLLEIQKISVKLVASNINEKEVNKKIKNLVLTKAIYQDKITKVNILYKSKNKIYMRIQDNLINIVKTLQKFTQQLEFVQKNSKCPLCKTKLQDNKKLNTYLNKEIEKVNLQIEKYKQEKIVKQKEIDSLINILENVRTKFLKIVELQGGLELKLQIYLNSKKNKQFLYDKSKYIRLLKLSGQLDRVNDIFNSKGLPLYLLNFYIPKLEFAINSELQKLINFRLEFRINKKLKNSNEVRNTCEFILLKQGREYSLSNLSNGQEFLVSLGIRLGVSKLYHNERKFETLIIDEGFGKLGEFSRNKVVHILNILKKKFKKIIVISHLDILTNLINSKLIYIEMHNGISKLISGGRNV